MNLTLPEDFIYLAPSAGCVHELCQTYPWCFSSVKHSQGVRHPLELVWPKLGAESAVKECCVNQGANGAELKVPSGAVKGWALLQLSWKCREGHQFFLPCVPGRWCCSNPFAAGEGLWYCPWGPRPFQSLRIIALEFPSGLVLPRAWSCWWSQGCACVWEMPVRARERLGCSTSLQSCQWCRDWAIESASCLLGKSWLIHFHIFSLFHLSCRLPNCSFPLPSLCSTLFLGNQTNRPTAKRSRETGTGFSLCFHHLPEVWSFNSCFVASDSAFYSVQAEW